VSATRSLNLFCCSDESLTLRARQVVSAPHSIVCVPSFPDDFLALCSIEGECYMLAGFLLLLWGVIPTLNSLSVPLSRGLSAFDMWVPPSCWLYFTFLMTLSLCPRQGVSAPLSMALFRCLHDTLALRSTIRESHSLATRFAVLTTLSLSLCFW